MRPEGTELEGVLLYSGRAYMQLGRPADAAASLQRVLAANPAHAEARYVLGMAQVSLGEPARALETLTPLFAGKPMPPAFYARALAHYGLKRKAEAQADIDMAIRLGLDNPNTRQWQSRIQAMP